jgi:methyl-accepting chemotaxis protein
VDQSTETDTLIAAAMGDLRRSADATRLVLSKSAEEVSDTLTTISDSMQDLGKVMIGVTRSIDEVRNTIASVQEASASIQSISMETQMIAINAGVEAARAGDAGRGFAVISQSIKSLAIQVRKFSDENRKNLEALQLLLDQMLNVARTNCNKAQSAVEASNTAKDATKQIQSLVSSVQQLTTGIEGLSEPIHRNARNSKRVSERVANLVTAVETADRQLVKTQKRASNILTISEELMLYVVEAGFHTRDSAIIEICQRSAAEVKSVFEAGVSSGAISLAALFDSAYRPVSGTNPEQVTTLFTAFTDRVLPAIQEAVLASSDRIAFCAAVDRNGYLPTHNLAYSKPQGPDPVWNAANSRNRRIFSDRTGLNACRNTLPFLLQTYRRDMGGGQYALMKDISAPIVVRGRHWGCLRMGVKP